MQGVTITKTRDGTIIATRPTVEPPETRQELEALGLKRVELADQVASLRRRRNSLTEDWHRASGDRRDALQLRIDDVNARIESLESSLDQVNAAIAAAPVQALTAAAPVPARRDAGDLFLDRLSRDLVPITGILSVFFLGPLAFAFARLMWRRASSTPDRAVLVQQAAMQRLEHLQQSVDAMAVEVERISEGQRYVSKLLNDRERAFAKLPGDSA